ncbi:MAG: hypothetical protein AAF604_00885 [Acidobacteriota bacterium]
MTPLPGGLGDALHLPAPVPVGKVAAWLAVAAALAFLGWLWRRRRRRHVPSAKWPRAVPKGPSRLESEVTELRADTLSRQRYREGCHRLAGLLRDDLDANHSPGWSALTAREIVERSPSRLALPLQRAARLQFRRREPSRQEVKEVFDATLAQLRDDPPSVVTAR